MTKRWRMSRWPEPAFERPNGGWTTAPFVPPFRGTILTKKAEIGNLVNPLAFGATSGAICEMADLADLEVELDITERDIAKVIKGMPCRVRAEAYPDRPYDGRRGSTHADRQPSQRGGAGAGQGSRAQGRRGQYLKPEMGAVVAFLQPAKKMRLEVIETLLRSVAELRNELWMPEPIVRVRDLYKSFVRGSEQIDVLNDLSLDVAEGEFLALMGPSGSGKTTLLNLIAGLDQPTAGDIWVGDHLISAMTESQLARWRTRARRLRLPVLPPAAGADGLRERRAAAAAVAAVGGGAQAAGADGPRPGRPVGPAAATGPASSPAASSSASASPAPSSPTRR